MDHFFSSATPSPKSAHFWGRKQFIGLIITLLAMSTLACGLLDGPQSRRVVIRVTLPTLTPTPSQIIASASPAEPAAPAGAASGPVVQVMPVAPAAAAAPSGLDQALAAPSNPGLASNNLGESAPPPSVASASDAPEPVNANPAPTTPPATPAPLPGAAASSVTAAPTPTLLPTLAGPTSTPLTPTPTPTTSAPPPGPLTFANVRTFNDTVGGGLLLYGDIVNQADSAQEIKLVTGQFLDTQGQVIADESRVSGYWPVAIVPPQDKVPFELFAEGIQNAADFKLRVEAQPTGSAPRRDFVVSSAYQDKDDFGLCVGGTLENPGGDIQDYLVVAAVLYDSENKMISFGDTSISPGTAITGQAEEFEICADSFGQNVGRYELQAWGY